MSRIRIFNANIITMACGTAVTENGVLTIDGERISYVGESGAEPEGIKYDR